jgi:AARP2CN (NUC121) domain
MFHHRASKLKQENKSHKRGTTSKRAIDNAAHGKVEKAGGAAAVAAAGGKHGAKHIAVADISRANRVNHAKQLRDAKKAEANLMKRLGGGASGPARNIAIVPLSAYASALGVASLLVDFADGATLPSVPAGFPAPLTLSYKAFRQDMVVSAPPRGGQLQQTAESTIRFDVTHTLAGVRGADIVVLVVNVSPAALSATAALMEAASDSPSGKSIQVPLPLHGGSTSSSSKRSRSGTGAGFEEDDDDDERMSSKHSIAGRSTKTGLTAGTTVAEAAAAGLVDAEGELFLACLKASGVPSLIGVIQGLDAYTSPAKQAEARKSAQRLFETEFGIDTVKLLEASDPVTYALSSHDPASSSASLMAGKAPSAGHLMPTPPPVPVAFTPSPKTSGAAMHLCRALCAVAPKTVHWRAQRSYLSAQALFWEPNSTVSASASGGEEPTGTLSLYGYLRGRPLNANQLVSLPWGGVYSLLDISDARDGMRKAPHTATNAVSTALTAEQASALVKSSSSSSASVSGGTVGGSGAVGGHGYAFSEAGSAYVPLSDAILAVPTMAGKIKVVSVTDLQMTGSLAPHGSASAGAGSRSATDADDAPAGLLAAANPHLAETTDTLAPPEDDEDGEQNLDGFEEDEDGHDDEEDEDDEDADKKKKGGASGGKKKRPAGMSKYQASWLADDVSEDEDEDEEEEDEEEMPTKKSSSSSAVAEGDDEDEDGEGGDDDDEDGDDVYAEGTLDPNGELLLAAVSAFLR